MRPKISGGVLIALIVGMIGAQTASAGQRPLHLAKKIGVFPQPLALGEVVTLVPSGNYTLVTPGGYLQCPSQNGGMPTLEDGALLATESATTDAFYDDTERLNGSEPCSTSTGLGDGHLGVHFDELTLNGNGKVEATYLQTFADFAEQTTCEYGAVQAKGRLAIGSAPVPLSISFSGARMKLNEPSAPICPKTAALYATFEAANATPVFASN